MKWETWEHKGQSVNKEKCKNRNTGSNSWNWYGEWGKGSKIKHKTQETMNYQGKTGSA